MLNKQKGNMYAFVTHTWNPIKGKCSHDCKYCYMKVYKQKPLRLVEKELNDDLGSGNFIFVGSSTDMFADNVPLEWIKKVLETCRKFDNKYLFQTKNTLGFVKAVNWLPKKSVLGTTIESNWNFAAYGNSPLVEDRIYWLEDAMQCWNTMVTIEPIMEFSLSRLVALIKRVKPSWVNIGADSKGHNLPEPSKEKVESLIMELEKFTEVKIKDNLKRITGKIETVKEVTGNG